MPSNVAKESDHVERFAADAAFRGGGWLSFGSGLAGVPSPALLAGFGAIFGIFLNVDTIRQHLLKEIAII